ncbi:MAG: methenyltetrahydromethanopterin cyclohydrolase [Methylotenera sp.]|uniref:methenyltetrahydromethanopterin cyclohydrolase n=1 Tax=Methylotenera sp. TaxID=2051956 RepID=UPI002727CCC8|nr:methenyltetrahydromethanopterin cyclohydrolase [Methylotenera sp.]MDO9204503.1 methenyltetrahydromethanopterin cyclohydrolase [Methylotenera sp.]MDO9393955.1 methenyltetrahydromethanopterin cyclohydrolase [Methylotenera sp.]MDP1521884.1 methenyltetrahydromethanopterin cyclohydrolase [Methylotenera sp.]
MTKQNSINSGTNSLSVNQLANLLVEKLIADADTLQLGISTHESGCTIIDAGIQHSGCAEAGRLIAEICMGGLGEVKLQEDKRFAGFDNVIAVTSAQPVLACLASQYAGWALSHEKFFSLGSGPARALAQREELFKELEYKDSATSTCIVLETDKIPPIQVIEKIVRDTQIPAENLTVILTPTTSIAGVVQIVGRVLEVALHKAHTLHFPLANIVSGSGVAVLPPVSQDFMTAMGRTNDAILFGGEVSLHVSCDDAAAAELALNLPSSSSKDYGKTFAQVFKFYNMDFYKIDPMLFSPAKVTITNLQTGKVFDGGQLNADLIALSFAN